jgi:hypothetical protein
MRLGLSAVWGNGRRPDWQYANPIRISDRLVAFWVTYVTLLAASDPGAIAVERVT